MPDPNYQIIVPDNINTIFAIASLSVIAIGTIYLAVKKLFNNQFPNRDFLDTPLERAKEGELAAKAKNP